MKTSALNLTVPDLTVPSAIAFSGGGDSTAMLHAFRGTPLLRHAFIIDHALRGDSAKEAAKAAAIARGFGYQVQIDRWAHDGISSGLQAKARDYRYAALGRMCREAGLTTLLTAHTEDDQAETLLMRLDRQTGWRGLSGIPETALAPLWPALAGVTLYRPWLHKSREQLREYNRRHSLSFIDDPSNENTAFARIRARQALAVDTDLRTDLLAQQKQMRVRLMTERKLHGRWLNAHAKLNLQGYVETDAVPPAELLLHILNAVSGRGGPIDSAKRERLCSDMSKPDFKAATLGGAWVIRKTATKLDGARHNFLFLRDRVAVTGRDKASSVKPIQMTAQDTYLWDGRFLCRAKVDDLRVETGLGHLEKLRQLPEFKALFDLPKEVRESLPIFFQDEKPVGFGACESEFMTVRAMSASRLQALFGYTQPVSI